MNKRAEWINSLEKILENFTKEFSKNKEDIKKDYVQRIREIISSAVSAARKSAGCLNNQVCTLLSALDKIENPTVEEVRCLSESHAGVYYMVDRKLASMAVKAGLQATFRPEISKTLDCVKEIENKAVDFIKGYTGKESLDSVITTIKEVGERL